MRLKKPRLIVTFHTTTAAMGMEIACNRAELPGRLIPVPREITAGCGMAWSAPPEARAQLEDYESKLGLAARYRALGEEAEKCLRALDGIQAQGESLAQLKAARKSLENILQER